MAGKPKTTKVKIDSTKNAEQGELNIVEHPQDAFLLIRRDRIKPSPTNPRKNFESEYLEEMAESIKRAGIIEPILVRRAGIDDAHQKLLHEFWEAQQKMDDLKAVAVAESSHDNNVAFARSLEKYSNAESDLRTFEKDMANVIEQRYELIAGERRWRAAELAGLEMMPAIIKEVSDNSVLEIQIIENLQRRDVHPLDEADGYENLRQRLGWSDEEIALRVGKSAGYVLNRLKLKNLGDESRKFFENNEITLSHALELCKYPIASQPELLDLCFDGGRAHVHKSLYPLKKFISRIEENFLLQLKKAPFSIKSTELRADGLACVNCPERTGAQSRLFEEHFSDKDACLNRVCWKQKTETHIQIQRRKIVEKDRQITDPVKAEKAVAKVPFITNSWYVDDKKKPAGKVLVRDDYKPLAKKDECEFAERGVFFDGDRIGQSQWICYDPKCKTHKKSSSGSRTVPNEINPEGRKIRKEEIFDSRVAEKTRRRVLKQSAEKFDNRTTIFNHPNAQRYELALLSRLWHLQCRYSEHTATVIREVLELEQSELDTSTWNDRAVEQIPKLSETTRSRLFFLLLHAMESEIFEAYWAYKSQKPIKELADEFGVDYAKIDAEERLAQAPMKQKDLFRKYLHEIEAGESPKVPRIWSTEWVAKD